MIVIVKVKKYCEIMTGLNIFSSVFAMILLFSAESLAGMTSNVKLHSNASHLFKTRSTNLRVLEDPVAVTRSPLDSSASAKSSPNEQRILKFERRNAYVESSTFNPDVLNRFLEEYASRIKSTTEKNYKYPFAILKQPEEAGSIQAQRLNNEGSSMLGNLNKSMHDMSIDAILKLDQIRDGTSNDTSERNKHGSNSSPYDDRNGWVTLEAVPWSKSKISKWQANQAAQRPEWPEHKPWPEHQQSDKPWPQRPTFDEEEAPWYDKPKPHYPENNYASQKPWGQDRPKPTKPSRPSYFDDNDFPEKPNYAQKWPPEQTWDRYSSDSSKTTSDIITDNRPANFPVNRDKPQNAKPSYNVDRFPEDDRDQISGDWNTGSYNFPSKFQGFNKRPSNFPQHSTSQSRPHFSQYHYPTEHPSSHPANGDGQWVLLSTNRGYSKSRQRSIKLGTSANSQSAEATRQTGPDPTIPVLSSRRQVRLTVLPSINGTNTTTSHGGLLEVEKTFKTVDQSQKEYENAKLATVSPTPATRPIRNTVSRQPSNSAVLAAVGAGMLPATMAMVIPMMLGRKKRSSNFHYITQEPRQMSILELNDDLVQMSHDQRKLRKLRL